MSSSSGAVASATEKPKIQAAEGHAAELDRIGKGVPIHLVVRVQEAIELHYEHPQHTSTLRFHEVVTLRERKALDIESGSSDVGQRRIDAHAHRRRRARDELVLLVPALRHECVDYADSL